MCLNPQQTSIISIPSEGIHEYTFNKKGSAKEQNKFLKVFSWKSNASLQSEVQETCV